MSMNDEQVWEDLSRFALAMKRGATVAFHDATVLDRTTTDSTKMNANRMELCAGIREIIEPPQKKVRPLNAEEWKAVAGCVLCVPYTNKTGGGFVESSFPKSGSQFYADEKATCHPPGFPNDVRKLWVEE